MKVFELLAHSCCKVFDFLVIQQLLNAKCCVCVVFVQQPGDLVHTLGDAHIYSNHVDGLREQV